MQRLIQKIESYLPNDKVVLIQEAYKFAMEAHAGQTRLSGEPFIEHPLETALFLAELNLDPATRLPEALSGILLQSQNDGVDSHTSGGPYTSPYRNGQ